MAADKTIPLTLVTKNAPISRAIIKPAKKIKVGLIQLGNSFSGQCYLPLSVGMFQAYAQKHLTYAADYEFTPPIYQFTPIDKVSELLSDCDIIGVSSYVWNEQNSLAIAQSFKRRNPNGVVVFGGPQVPDSKKQFRRIKTDELTHEETQRKRMHFTEDFHRAHPFIDIACHGEGERVFKVILEQLAIDECKDKSQIPSASYLDADGNFHFNNKIGRMTDHELAKAPSPFTNGVFDALMSLHPDQKWIVMYETDRGCPYTCTYCDWGGATEDRISKFPMKQIYADIMWFGEHQIPYVFLCNANFGILERDVQIAEFFAEAKTKYGYLEGVSTQNAKNPKKHTIRMLKVLEKSGLNKAAVMSQQSLNSLTLQAVRRNNMKLDEYYVIQKDLAAQGVYTMTDMIIPMPEETHQSVIRAVDTLIQNGQHNHIHFNILSILRNTEMGNPEYQEKYGFEIVRTKIINTHGKRNSSISGIEEYQELVVATNTMPAEIWPQTMNFCWSAVLFYFNKLLQIPIIILCNKYGVSYGEMLQLLSENFRNYGQFPILEEIRTLFIETAQGIQKGKEEYIHTPHWLNIWWPPQEYALIKLVTENKIDGLYEEAEEVTARFLSRTNRKIPLDLLPETMVLNRSLMKMPFQNEDLKIELSYNILEIYKGVLIGKEIPLKKEGCVHLIDRTTVSKNTAENMRWDTWEEWCQKVVWYGNRQGAYFYGNKNPNSEIEGHH